ncbi:MAG: response regulator [Gammaproteobacteria bacterium]|nr:response regulator [Gammaproteobacteria bacterium]
MSEHAVNNNISVLFVDDEKNILSSLNRLFRSEGYNIFLANSGKEGLDIMANNTIDLVVSDMRMPEMNGAQFLEQVSVNWPSSIRILLTGYSEITSTIDAINKGNIYKYISKPWEDYDLKLTIKNALDSKKIELERDKLLDLTRKQNTELKEFNNNLEAMVEARTSELNQTMGMLESAYDSLKQSYTSTIKVFSNIIEMREGTLRGHSKIVAEAAKKLALKVGLTDSDAQQISYAGLLRDIGKIGLSDKVINKPFNTLSPYNQKEYVKHPIIGAGILMAIDPLHDAAQIIRSYRERFDGKGYPDNLLGKEIPIGSRILAIVSDYDSLQIGVLAETRMSSADAKDYISTNSGHRYDPDIVKAFLEVIDINENLDNIKNNDDILVPAAKLQQNMILAKDLIAGDGVVLLSEGHRLGEHMIRQVQNLENSLNEKLVIYIRS